MLRSSERAAQALALLLALGAAPALAEEPADADGEGAEAAPAEDAAPPSATPAVQALRQAIDAAAGGDAEAAIDACRVAIGEDANYAEAHLVMGMALAMNGEHDDALASLQLARQRAAIAEDRFVEGRALVNIARVLEGMEGRLADARRAWVEAAEFGAAHSGTVNPAVSSARLDAIDAALALVEPYAAVRARIAEREAANAEESSSSGGSGSHRRGRH